MNAELVQVPSAVIVSTSDYDHLLTYTKTSGMAQRLQMLIRDDRVRFVHTFCEFETSAQLLTDFVNY